ncbi:alpha/beta hydrolase [Bacillus sp. KH172YL63]|nr:alpha/beta hydrolase [Bacillus sp. KH172YL63]
MLHGFMGTAHTHFSHQISYFGESYELITLDLPGHGHATVASSPDYIEDTITYLIHQLRSTGPGLLMGLSLGASLAIHTALRAPEQVEGVVLTGYSPFIPEELKGIMEKQHEFFLNIEEHDEEAARHFHDLHGEKWKETIQHVLHTMTFHYPAVTKEDLLSIKTPVLLLNGSHDVHEVEAVSFVNKSNPEIEVGLIPDAGHTANIDQPEIFNRVVGSFLNRHSH